MAGGGPPDAVRRPGARARGATRRALRAAYAGLAWVFAEMAGRKQLWKTGLEGFDVQESEIVRGWRQEGIEKGSLMTARAAVVKVLQARFPEAPVHDGGRA